MTRLAARLGGAALLVGALALVTAGAWWWLVFRQLVLNAYITVPRALPCMVGESDLCTLAQALCKSDHFLGIRHYDIGLFWAGAGLLAAGLAAPALRRGKLPA